MTVRLSAESELTLNSPLRSLDGIGPWQGLRDASKCSGVNCRTGLVGGAPHSGVVWGCFAAGRCELLKALARGFSNSHVYPKSAFSR